MPDYYPVFLNLKGRTCLVVGGGEVAERKVHMLVASGARVRVISPRFNNGIKSLAAKGDVELVNRGFEPEDLEGAFLAIAATGDTEVNHQVAVESERRNILVNVVDTPSEGNFIVPSMICQGGLTIAISTSGKSPALARKLRHELEKSFAPRYAILLEIVSQVRRDLLSQGRRMDAEAWQASLDMELMELVDRGETELARERLVNNLEKWNKA